ncbi:MAG: topoisomerase C-terminal repeat-containing protein [Parasporobacterium sp.]|nr:topoisomerase C-terminal repeat-containing protein [Parasporobacterium sp.]
MIGILNEKQSQARNFAKALGGMKGSYNGEEYVIAPARGHLFGFVDDPSKQVASELSGKYASWNIENLPWNEEDFKWYYEKKKDVSDVVKNIQEAFAGCDEIAIATDDDPTGEGELLAWEIIALLGLKVPKYSRIFFADESEKEIRKGFSDRKILGTGMSCMHSDPDYRQALFRTKWDYLSMQWTRIATRYSPYGQVPRQGRLKSVMVRLVGDQLKAVDEYVKKPFFQNRFRDENGVMYVNNSEPTFVSKEDVPADKYTESAVIVDSAEKKRSVPPKFLDLASLGGMLASKGISAKTVLSTYQKMYEASVVSYPRTEDKSITIEQYNELLPLVDKIADLVGVDRTLLTHRKPRKTHVSTGMAHGANRPGPKVPSDLSSLDSTYGPGARKIYEILARNYLATLCEDYEYEHQKGHLEKYPAFTGKADVPEKPGWKQVYGDTEEKNEDEFASGLGRMAKPFVYEGVNPKPKNPTMKWLMKQLEKHDVGTGATRTSIYADVTNAKSKYPLLKETKGRLSMQPNGETSYRLIQGTHIAGLDLTEKVMKQMKEIYEGKTDGKAYLHDIQQMIMDDMQTMRENSLRQKQAKTASAVGKCPLCGEDILESEKGWYCSSWKKGCKTGMFRNSFGTAFTREDFLKALAGETIENDGHKFTYDIRQAKLMEHSSPSGIACPCCGGYLNETSDRYSCPCGFGTMKKVAGVPLTQAYIAQLRENKQTEVINGFTSSKGRKFKARIKLNGKKLEFDFS